MYGSEGISFFGKSRGRIIFSRISFSKDLEIRGFPWQFWTKPQTQYERQLTGQRILKQM